ncbi:MAG TPA: hypothetical protein VMP11_15830, partial [Verrucomicrobiae bacterium]|nr:hypothetical protein [Verrucomicrobiae bacterium]
MMMMMAVARPVRSQDSTNPVRSATDAARERERQERAGLPIAKGTLTSIDFARHEIQLKTVDGVQTLLYTLRTYVFRSKQKITVDGLKVGETIAVRFDTDPAGVRTIVRIKAYAPSGGDAPAPAPPTDTKQPARPSS